MRAAFRWKPDYCVWVTSQLSPERSPSTTNCITANVWHQLEIWNENYKVYLTLLSARLADISTACLILSLSPSCSSPSSHRCMHYCSLSHAHTYTLTHTHTQAAVVSSLSAVVPCCRLAVTTPVLGLLFGRKACIGQILFRQIKKSMSSCLHQSTHCLSDSPTTHTTALLYPCLSRPRSFPHPSLFIWMHYLLFLRSAYSPSLLYFRCRFPVRLWFRAWSTGAAVTGVLAVELD